MFSRGFRHGYRCRNSALGRRRSVLLHDSGGMEMLSRLVTYRWSCSLISSDGHQELESSLPPFVSVVCAFDISSLISFHFAFGARDPLIQVEIVDRRVKLNMSVKYDRTALLVMG